MYSSYHTEWKTFIKASCSTNTYTGEIFFLELLLLEGCELFLFRQSEKLAVYFGLWEFYLDVQSREDQINTVYERTNFLFVTRYFLLVTRYFLLVTRYF